MANFPSSPSNGDTHIIGNTIWVYNSTSDSWIIQDVNEYAIASLENTPPASPDEGTLWFDDQTTGRLYVYINGSWIDASPGELTNIVGGTNVTATTSGTTVTISSTDTDTTYSAGSGIDLTGTTFSHSDTSSQGSVNNSGTTFIQDITVDGYGHITGIGSATMPSGGSGTTSILGYASGGDQNTTLSFSVSGHTGKSYVVLMLSPFQYVKASGTVTGSTVSWQNGGYSDSTTTFYQIYVNG